MCLSIADAAIKCTSLMLDITYSRDYILDSVFVLYHTHFLKTSLRDRRFHFKFALIALFNFKEFSQVSIISHESITITEDKYFVIFLFENLKRRPNRKNT